jgi:predicted aspartyl protease
MARTVQFWISRLSPMIALALLSLPCPAAGPRGDSIALKNGFVFVNVIINGHGPFRMLVDTGTTTSLLAPEAAAKAGLVYDHRVVVTSLGGEKPLPATSSGELRIGSAVANDVEIGVTSIGRVRQIDPGAHGILGQSFLSRSAYLIDYARKQLWLGEDAVQRAVELPFALSAQQANGRTILPVTLQTGGPSWRLTLDSGASNLILKCNTRCPLIADPRSDDQVLALVGQRPAQSGILRQVNIAGARMSFVHALLVDTQLPDGQDDGVLPSQWFSAVYVDGTSGLVRLAQRR